MALSACDSGSEPEFRIGLLALEGENYTETSGEPSIRGARFAAEHANAEGGVLVDGVRHTVRIIVRRYTARPDQAATAARALINRDSVDAIVGPQLSAHAIPVSVIAEDVSLPMVSPMSSNPQTTRDKRFVFRVAFLNDVQAAALARHAVEELEATRAALLYDVSVAYAASVAEEFAGAFTRMGGAVVARETYTTDQNATFVAQLERIRAADADVLLLPNPSWEDSIQVVEAEAMGLDVQILGTDTWDLQRLSTVPAAEGAIVSHQWHSATSDPLSASFVEEFRARYDRTPRTTTAMTYDAVGVLVAAANRAGSLAGPEVAGALRTLRGYRGATGWIAYHGSGDPDRTVALSTLRDGRIVPVQVTSPPRP